MTGENPAVKQKSLLLDRLGKTSRQDVRKRPLRPKLTPVLFHKNRPPGCISPQIRLQGQASFLGSGIFSASLEGDLSASETLTVDPSASVHGSLHAKQIDLAGSVQGTVEAQGHSHLRPSARLQGTLVARSAEIEAGATFHGEITIGPAA